MDSLPVPSLPVLVVDDEESALRSTERMLRWSGMNNVLSCSDSRAVMGIIEGEDIGVVLLDLTMPHISGEELLVELKAEFPWVPVIIVTGADEVTTAVQCMQSGAFDYMVKPVERSRLLSGVRRAVELRELERENSQLRKRLFSDALEHPDAFGNIVTRDAAMLSVFRYVETVAPTPRPVLVTGETGVGKELIGRALHTLSGRKGSFVAVNAAGVDDNVFSDTLFGHVRGAFTGAAQRRAGLIEQAAGGTLFLDEIADLPPVSQIKLLRLVQEREYLPLGSDIPKHADARIIAATNRDLDMLQGTGMFRRDLYHRLQTHRIHIPPLRERKGDIPLLVDHFLRQAAESLGKRTPRPPDEIGALLASYHFPGNIRELEAMVFDAVSKHTARMLSLDSFRERIGQQRGMILPEPEGAACAAARPFAQFESIPTLQEGTRLLIAEAMRRANGNQRAAAALLGISRTALNKRLRQSNESNGPQDSSNVS